jgi:hypothetical protein
MSDNDGKIELIRKDMPKWRMDKLIILIRDEFRELVGSNDKTSIETHKKKLFAKRKTVKKHYDVAEAAQIEIDALKKVRDAAKSKLVELLSVQGWIQDHNDAIKCHYNNQRIGTEDIFNRTMKEIERKLLLNGVADEIPAMIEEAKKKLTAEINTL